VIFEPLFEPMFQSRDFGRCGHELSASLPHVSNIIHYSAYLWCMWVYVELYLCETPT